MDSNLQSGTLTIRAKVERMSSPQERAEAARRRILQALENPPGGFPAYLGRNPVSAVAFALAGGFIIGCWPGAGRVLAKNLGGLLRLLYNLQL